MWGQWGIELGGEGTVEGDEKLEVYFSYDLQQASVSFCRSLREAGLEHDSKWIEDRDWNELWEKSFRPVHIGQELVIRAPFHPYFPDHLYTIEVNPERAFGTGHHPTTRLMLQKLLQISLDEKHVLDMGCGTGILSILCEMRGASEVSAIDNDEWAVKNCRSTVQQNGCQKVHVEYGRVVPWKGRDSDVILGNIQKRPLMGMIPDMEKNLSVGGILLLSGLRKADIQDVEDVCRKHGLKKEAEKEEEGWCILAYLKG